MESLSDTWTLLYVVEKIIQTTLRLVAGIPVTSLAKLWVLWRDGRYCRIWPRFWRCKSKAVDKPNQCYSSAGVNGFSLESAGEFVLNPSDQSFRVLSGKLIKTVTARKKIEDRYAMDCRFNGSLEIVFPPRRDPAVSQLDQVPWNRFMTRAS